MRCAKPFHDSGLAHAWRSDQHGVVLGASREDLHDALDLVVAPDDGVELALSRHLGQVASELVEGWGARALRARSGRRLPLMLLQVHHLASGAIEFDAKLVQHARRQTLALPNQSQKQVFRADVVVVQLPRLVVSEVDDTLRARGELHLCAVARLAAGGVAFNLVANALQAHPHPIQNARRDAVRLAH
jgi:hypothetical protein